MNVLWKTIDIERAKRGLSLKQIGKICSISPQGVQTWKNSGRVPVEHLQTLATYFNVSVDHLLTGEKPSTETPITHIREKHFSYPLAGDKENDDLRQRIDDLTGKVETLSTQMTTLIQLLSGRLAMPGEDRKEKAG